MQSTLSKVRKLRPNEIFLEVAQSEFQFAIPCYWLTLEAKEEVTEGQVEQTLRILYRNIDILRLCIRKEKEDFWFYEMDEERILLQVLKNQSPYEVFDKETHTNFNSATGPLWRAIYFPDNETVKESNVYTSNIMLTFDHAIVDGFTCFSICNSFLMVLNDVIGGKVENSYDFGKFNDGHEIEVITQQRMEYLNKNPEYFAEIKTFLTNFDKQKIRFDEFFPLPEDVEKKTKYIHGEIDKETTKKLLKVFKSKGISFNSGFSAAINWALMELFVEKGLTDKEIDLQSEHAINVRRYWKKSSTLQLGSHSTSLKLSSKTDKNVGANFWEYARNFGSELKNALDNMQGIDVKLQMKTSNFGKTKVDYSKLMEDYPPPKSYYCTTNMGDLKSIVQGKREYVRIKWLTRGVASHGMNASIVSFIHTYEGRFLYCIGYSTHIVRDDLANLLVDRIIGKLNILSNMQ
ncbi:hypothetical protein Avbf_09953, partial [Armadillidium vulgare]